MTSKTDISIAHKFSKFPAGRYLSDGSTSGQAFRESILVPALSKEGDVQVDLDGTEGYGSSFLEEAFGGLIRVHGFKLEDLDRRLSFKSEEDPSLLIEIQDYLTRAAALVSTKSSRS